MIVNIGELEAPLAAMLDRGEMDNFLLNIRQIVYQLVLNPQLKGRALFIPALDMLMQRAGKMLAIKPVKEAVLNLIIHVATEVYTTGGHTRTMEDMVRALPEYRHILILTDAIEHYRTGRLSLGPLKERFNNIGLEVLFLKPNTPAIMAQELCTLIASLSPQAILLQAHHFDMIAHAAITGQSAPRVLFIHHGDHNPGLGAARSEYLHVDHSSGCYQLCKGVLTTSPVLLELTVKDQGTITIGKNDALTGVTCGAPSKYEGRQEFTYAELLAALFAAGVMKMVHIGSMPTQQMTQIKEEIKSAGQDPQRILFLPDTPSLARALLEIAPDFYLRSHPIGGGKSTIEAMSAGLPILDPHPASSPSLIHPDMTYGGALKITSLAEVPAVISMLLSKHKDLRLHSRRMYEQHYSTAVFRNNLLRFVQPTAELAVG